MKTPPFKTRLLACLLVPLLLLSTAPPLLSAVTGRTEDTSLAGTEKVLMDSSGVDTYALVSTIRAVGAMTSGTITGTTISGLTVTTTTGTLTIPNGVTLTGPAVSGTAATLDGTQTLTNKTLTFADNTISLTSAQLITACSNETGTGSLVFATSPTLVTPTLGVATATSINGLTISASTGTLTVTNGKTLAVSNTLTFTGTDASSVAFGAGGTVAYAADNLSVFASTTSAQFAGVISNETGSGVVVLATSPTLVTPVLGVATATSINKMAITAPATGSTLAVADGKTLTASNTLTLAGTDSTTMTFPATSGYVMTSTLSTNDVSAANGVWGASNAIVMEGATANGFEAVITATDPTADTTATLPKATGTFSLAQASTTTALTADNQAVTPGPNTVLQLTSDNATDTNRTFTLSATGAITGQIYVIIGPATNACEIADTGIQVLSATWSPGAGDTLTLLFDGTNFNEIARSNN